MLKNDSRFSQKTYIFLGNFSFVINDVLQSRHTVLYGRYRELVFTLFINRKASFCGYGNVEIFGIASFTLSLNCFFRRYELAVLVWRINLLASFYEILCISSVFSTRFLFESSHLCINERENWLLNVLHCDVDKKRPVFFEYEKHLWAALTSRVPKYAIFFFRTENERCKWDLSI